MLKLSENNICLNAIATDKNEAISQIASSLIANGNVAEGYEAGMLAREAQTSTYLGNGIAIPHGTLETRSLVQQTGVQIYQFPQGVEWSENNTAYVVIGIAAKSDEHLTLLRQLTSVLSDEQSAQKLATTQNIDEFIAILTGNTQQSIINEQLISLNIETNSLLTLTAINAAKLQEQGYVDQIFISDILAQPALFLGNGVWLNDSTQGNQQNGIAIARAISPFLQQEKTVQTLITISCIDDKLQPLLSNLLDPKLKQQISSASVSEILTIFGGESTYSNEVNLNENLPASTASQVIGTFTVRNEHGLHARPSAVMVQTLKPFVAKITVENLDRPAPAINAKSLMKIVSLGATKNHRLRFVAEGEDAATAIQALADAFESGLGEKVTFEPTIADTIETIAVAAENPITETSVANVNGFEAIFTVHNEHGLHARPTAVLVNEVKKYNAAILAQNIDRDSQLVSAKSLMKMIALGVQKGHRLRFVATGEEAQKALDGIGKAIEQGLGE